MHTVELLDQAKTAAQMLGYRLREEWLDGSGGGVCEIRGTRYLFVDLALSTSDQLDQLLEALKEDQGIDRLTLSPPLSRRLGIRRSA